MAGTIASRWLDMLGISKANADDQVALPIGSGSTALETAASSRAVTPHARLLDIVPVPVWLRDADLSLTYVNRQHAETAGMPNVSTALATQLELGAGQLGTNGKALARRALRTGHEQTESISLVVNGCRRLFQVVERPTEDGGIAGTAMDLTDVDDAHSELASHMNAHQEVLEQLRAGIAVFDGERRLRFVNRAYATMWGLDYGWLSQGPRLNDILEKLGENRGLPEVIDFAESLAQKFS